MTIPAITFAPARSQAQDAFDTNVEGFITQLIAVIPVMNTDIATTNTNAATATTKAAEALASAASANGAAGAAKWVSGTTYAQGVCVWSPANYGTYRRIVAGAGTTDPSADATNWIALPIVMDSPVFTGTAQFSTLTGTGAISTVGGVGAGVFFNVQTSTGLGFYQSAGNTLNFNHGADSDNAGLINYRGYNNGITRFRDLIVYDGKQVAIATFTGSTKAATFAGAVLSSNATAGIGYTTGAGGEVTQATSKSTGVTLNKICGGITTHNAALAAGAVVTFTVTNSAVAIRDVVHVTIASGATSGAYHVSVSAMGAGAFNVSIRNMSAGSLSEAIILNFAVIKSVIA